jgi:hypothetical protein
MMRRALLVAGGVNKQLNHRRYANNVGAFYRTLTRQYGYAPSDVRVLLADGAQYDATGAGDLLPALAATEETFDRGLAWLAEQGEGCLAVLIVTDHGDGRGIALWGHRRFRSPGDLQAQLGPCNAHKLLVFGQCQAGLFRSLELSRAVVVGACGRDEQANARPNLEYSEFLYRLCGAFAGVHPEQTALAASVTPPPDVSVLQAFEYACSTDCYAQPHPPVGYKETPFLHDPHGLASQLCLGGTPLDTETKSTKNQAPSQQ